MRFRVFLFVLKKKNKNVSFVSLILRLFKKGEFQYLSNFKYSLENVYIIYILYSRMRKIYKIKTEKSKVLGSPFFLVVFSIIWNLFCRSLRLTIYLETRVFWPHTREKFFECQCVFIQMCTCNVYVFFFYCTRRAAKRFCVFRNCRSVFLCFHKVFNKKMEQN